MYLLLLCFGLVVLLAIKMALRTPGTPGKHITHLAPSEALAVDFRHIPSRKVIGRGERAAG